MSVAVSNFEANTLMLTMAIETCCMELIDNELAMNAELGAGIAAGLTAASTAFTACCNARIAADIVTIPPVLDEEGNTIAPGYTGPWQGYQSFAYQQTINRQTAAAEGSYQDYLDQLDEWRQQQLVPIFAALLANLGLIFDQLELYNKMLDCTIELLNTVKAEAEAMEALSTGTLIPAVQAKTDAMMAKFGSAGAMQAICDQREGIVARSDSMWACFENVFKPELTQYYADFMGEMFSHGAAGSEQQIELRDLNRDMRACWNSYIKEQDQLTHPALGVAIRNMMEKADDACDWLEACADDIKDHWDTTRAENDAKYAKAACEAAVAHLNGTQESKIFFEGCRDAWKAIHTSIYHAKEAVHIPGLQQEACDTLGIHKAIADCAFECSEDEKQRYIDTYEAKEAALATVAMSEACLVHPCFREIADCLKKSGDDLEACWDELKAKNTQYLCDFIEKIIERLCRTEEQLEDHCEKLLTFCDHWEACYKTAECQLAPKLIFAGNLACEKHESVYEKVCNHADHLWDKFENTWCDWDQQDALMFCNFWVKTNPLNELCDNHECQQDMADLLKDCYEDIVLPWEKAYIREICNMDKYQAKYCETESSAIALIRAQYSKVNERIIKQNPRYCAGATKQQLINNQNERIRAEAAAMQSANRDERWWETQECDRRHRYTMEVLERLGKRFPEHALQFYQGSSNILDGILGRMHERLLRGYEYMRNSNDFDRTVLNATQVSIDASQRMVQLGQFYPQLYAQSKNDHIRNEMQFLNVGHDSVRLGQFYRTQGSQDKERAANVANQSAQWGFQHMQHGIQHTRTALDAKQVSQSSAQSAQANALQSYALGQDYLRLALASAQEQTNQLNTSVNAANTMATTGVQYAGLAADKMQAVMQAGLEGIRQGNQFAQHSRLFAGQIQSGYTSVVSNGIAAYDEFLKSYRVGIEQVQVAQAMDATSLNTALSTMEQTCDFLSRNHCCTGQVAAQSSGGGLAAAQNLLSGAAQGIQSGFNGAIGSLTALNQPPVPPTIFGNTSAVGGTPFNDVQSFVP